MRVRKFAAVETSEIVIGVRICDLVAELVSTKMSTGPTIERVDIAFGASDALHCHNQFDQFFLVTAGAGYLHHRHGSQPLTPEDFFVLQRGRMHAITSEKEGMSLLCVSSPRFVSGDVHYM